MFDVGTALAAELWGRYFEQGKYGPPVVYWGGRFRRRGRIHAVCTGKGILLNRHNFMQEALDRRGDWLEALLKHELLHWAGYDHYPHFWAYLKLMETP